MSELLSFDILHHLTAFRQQVHANPEVSGEETETAEAVALYLKGCNPQDMATGIGGTGIIAVWDSGQPGPTIMLRAELDALPIQETGDAPYASKNAGVAHMCGHDGHLTNLLAVAQLLKDNPPQKGKAMLLFQPAEEDGRGAAAMIADPAFAPYKPDLIFALHNLPGYPMHQVVMRPGTFTAYVKSLIIRLRGKTAHAAEPEHGHNPAPAIAQIIQYTEALANNHPEQDDFSVITPIYINLGEEAYGIAAGYGELHYTIRTWTPEVMSQLEDKLLDQINIIATEHQLQTELEWTHEFHANQNHEDAQQAVERAAQAANANTVYRPYPFKWGEDFGLFTQQFKGALFGLGSGEHTPALHNPDYDYPDELIPTAANLFFNIFKQYLY